jgi:hypothetical protein
MTGVSAAIPRVVPSEWRAGWKAEAVLKHKPSATIILEETMFGCCSPHPEKKKIVPFFWPANHNKQPLSNKNT